MSHHGKKISALGALELLRGMDQHAHELPEEGGIRHAYNRTCNDLEQHIINALNPKRYKRRKPKDPPQLAAHDEDGPDGD